MNEVVITEHAKQRYAERIMNREDRLDVNRFIAEHAEKIQTDIQKMVQYGQQIYFGKSLVDSNKKDAYVWMCGCWILILDADGKRVVTLYEVDLGLDKEFNKRYVNGVLEKLTKEKETTKIVLSEIEKENEQCIAKIKENEELIKEFTKKITELKNQCEGYQAVLDGNKVKKSLAEENVRDIIKKLLGMRAI